MTCPPDPTRDPPPAVLPYRTRGPVGGPPRGGGSVWLVVSWFACGAAASAVVGGFAWAWWQAKANPSDEGVGITYAFVMVLAAMASLFGLLIALVAAAGGDRVARRSYRRAVLPWLLALTVTAGPIGAFVLWQRLR